MYPWHMEAEAIRSELVEQPQSSAVTKQFYDNFRNPKESRCLEMYCSGRAVQASSSYGPRVPPPLLSSRTLPVSDWPVLRGAV